MKDRAEQFAFWKAKVYSSEQNKVYKIRSTEKQNGFTSNNSDE